MERQSAPTDFLDLVIRVHGLAGAKFLVGFAAAQPGITGDPKLRATLERWQADLRRITCGRPARRVQERTDSPRPADPRLEQLHEETEAARADQRRARIETAERRAHQLAGSASGGLSGHEDDWLLKYDELRKEGKGHLEAIHHIAGYDPKAPRQLQDHIPMDLVVPGISRARARAKAQAGERRNAEIISLARDGLSRREIADRLTLSYAIVCLALTRAGIHPPDRRRKTT